MSQQKQPERRDGHDGRHDEGVGTSKREYPHSSGDRNSRDSEEDWPTYKDGVQRDADPSGAADGGGSR